MTLSTKEKKEIPIVVVGNFAYEYIIDTPLKTWFFAPRQSGKTTLLGAYMLHYPEAYMVVLNSTMRDYAIDKMGIESERIVSHPKQWDKIVYKEDMRIVIDDFDFEKVTWHMPDNYWDRVKIVTTSTLNFDYIQSDNRLKFQVERIMILNQLKI